MEISGRTCEVMLHLLLVNAQVMPSCRCKFESCATLDAELAAGPRDFVGQGTLMLA